MAKNWIIIRDISAIFPYGDGLQLKIHLKILPSFKVQLIQSMLRLDATAKKRYDGKLFKFKNFSIKQAFFINENFFSSPIKAHTQKKI